MLRRVNNMLLCIARRHAVLWRVAAVVPVIVCACAQQLGAQTFTYKDGGIWYLCNETTKEAVLVASKSADDGYVYTDDALHIPATITVSGGSYSGGGGSESSNVYAVTEIGEGALKDSWAFTITFDDKSNLRVIRKQGLYGISVSGTLTLPASLRVIEEEGLYVKSSAKAKDFISTLVLPAGLDSLGKSAIVLNKLQTLQFLGTTPPKCHYTESSNPWAGTDAATPDNITVTYPEGAYAAYNNRKGIGTYFTSFTGPDETPTGLEERQETERATAVKVMRNGQVLIVREGRCYTAMGQLVIDN